MTQPLGRAVEPWDAVLTITSQAICSGIRAWNRCSLVVAALWLVQPLIDHQWISIWKVSSDLQVGLTIRKLCPKLWNSNNRERSISAPWKLNRTRIIFRIYSRRTFVSKKNCTCRRLCRATWRRWIWASWISSGRRLRRCTTITNLIWRSWTHFKTRWRSRRLLCLDQGSNSWCS